MSSWHEPRWSRPPPGQYKWSLDEIKGGIVLSKHRVSERCVTFGRAADTVSVPTAHESCSRLHARLAFDGNGVPWLRDLGSGNGTFVNKKRLPSKACGKVEDGHGEGSRGVVVFPGDMIVLGASTRLFCLVGPEEFGRHALEEKRAKEKAALAQAKATESVISEGDENCISWGIDTVEHSGNDGDALVGGDQSLEPLDTMTIPPRHRKLYEKLMSKKYKRDNLRSETGRIQSKAVISDLTDGQQNQLEKNRQKEETLSTEIEEMEQEIRQNLSGQGAQSSNSRKRDKENARGYGDEDEDDFYDRTLAKKRRDEPRPEDAETLTAKWKTLVSMLNRQEDVSRTAQRKVANIEARLGSASGDKDELFFIKNDLELAIGDARKAKVDASRTGSELLGAEKMLRLVDESLVFDRCTEFVGNKAAYEKLQVRTDDSHKMLPPKKVCPPRISDDTMPPPSIPPSHERSNGIDKSVAAQSNAKMGPPQISDEMMPPPSIPPSDGIDKSVAAQSNLTSKISPTAQPEKMAPPTKRKPQGPMRPPEGTLAVLLSASKASSGASKNMPSSAEKKLVASAGENKVSSSLSHKFDPRKDEWMAPSGQDGSGVTKLNKKFEGRY